MNESPSIYLLPPVLSLAGAIYLAVLALSRGPMNREKGLFALVCLWSSLLAPAFICHYLVRDEAQILSIERHIHFFFVYLPMIATLFYHHMARINRKWIIITLAVISFLFSLTTATDYYFNGLNRFSWGYIAKGGIAFQLFGLYAALSLLYCVYCSVRILKREHNPRLRLKHSYMLVSFLVMGFMTFMNIPAIQGIDLYPIGNFSFLPLAIMGYGLLKHHLLEIRSLMHITLTRVLFCIILLIPNYYVFDHYAAAMARQAKGLQFIIFSVWFSLNYLYIQVLNRMLRRWFHKDRHVIQNAKSSLSREMLVLRSAQDLSHHVTLNIVDTLPIPWARVDLYDSRHKALVTQDGHRHDLSDRLALWLARHSGILEDVSAPTAPVPVDLKDDLARLMDLLNAIYVMSLVHNDALIGLLVLPAKENEQPLNEDEADFLKSISQALALAMSNAVMYQHISSLKDRLQGRTQALTEEIRERKETEKALKEVQQELQEANSALELAILEANEMRAKVEINNHELTRQMEERKRAEAALRESEATYRLIAESATDVIWTMNLEGRFTFMSPAVQHLLGYTPDEMLALTSKEVLTAESFEKTIRVIAEEMELNSTPTAERAKSRATELEQVRKDGTTVWTEVNTRFIQDEKREIIGILGVTRDISERRKSEQALIHMAHHDALTGLYNRKAFMEFLEKELKYAQRYDTGLALLFFDLNKFKLVNDTYGHATGDQLLRSVAERLKTAVRETDYIARLGGDEFTIILKAPDTILSDIVAQRIVDALSRTFHIGDHRIEFVSASIGIATFPQNGRMAEQLMKSADMAMYEAKKADAHWVHFDEMMADSTRQQASQSQAAGN